MFFIYESKKVRKGLQRLPKEILRKYNLWKEVVRSNGPQVLRNFPGYHDEALKGVWKGFRSSRLNLQYRVIYRQEKEMVFVEEVNPHRY